LSVKLVGHIFVRPARSGPWLSTTVELRKVN
jgi:hypothetical protein